MSALKPEDFDYDPYYLNDHADDRMYSASTHQIRNEYHTLLSDDEIELRRKYQRSTTRPLLWSRRDIRDGGGINREFVQFMTPAHVTLDNKFNNATSNNCGRSSDVAYPVGTTKEAIEHDEIIKAHGGVDKVYKDLSGSCNEPQLVRDKDDEVSDADAISGGIFILCLIVGLVIDNYIIDIICTWGVTGTVAYWFIVGTWRYLFGRSNEPYKGKSELSGFGRLTRTFAAMFIIAIMGPIGWVLGGYWMYKLHFE